MKPSGIDWIGDIPTHWRFLPLKRLVPHVTVGIVVQPASLYTSEGVPCLRSLNVSSGSVTTSDIVYISPESNRLHAKSQIFAGDIVVVRTGRAGIAVVVPPEFDGCNCIDLLIIRQSPQVLSDYLLLYLNSYAAKTEVESKSVGAIQAHYNTGTLANLYIPVPPIEEQKRILHYATEEVSSVTMLTKKAGREIELIHEYRTRLIADVVTGKLDVRNAVFPESETEEEWEIPDEAGEDELDANSEEMTEDADDQHE